MSCAEHRKHRSAPKARKNPDWLIRINGIRNIAAAVPGQAPDIERVIQDARAAVDLTADSGVAPHASARARNAFRVQLVRNLTRRLTGGVVFENSLHDRRFHYVDPAFPRLLGAGAGGTTS